MKTHNISLITAISVTDGQQMRKGMEVSGCHCVSDNSRVEERRYISQKSYEFHPFMLIHKWIPCSVISFIWSFNSAPLSAQKLIDDSHW